MVGGPPPLSSSFLSAVSVLLHQELAYPDDLVLRKVLVIKGSEQGLRECVVAVKAFVELVACTVLSPLYEIFSPLLLIISAGTVLAGYTYLSPWSCHTVIMHLRILIHLC